MPINDKGTDCKLKAKLKIEMEPVVIRDANETSTNVASWFAESVTVLGKAVRMIRLTLCQSKVFVNLGKYPSENINGTWMIICKNAPEETPMAIPVSPNNGYPTTTPRMMDRL